MVQALSYARRSDMENSHARSGLSTLGAKDGCKVHLSSGKIKAGGTELDDDCNGLEG